MMRLGLLSFDEEQADVNATSVIHSGDRHRSSRTPLRHIFKSSILFSNYLLSDGR